LSVACSIDVHSLRWAETPNIRKGSLVIYLIEQDPTGKVLQKWDKTFNLQFTESQYATLLMRGMLFHQTVHPRAGVTTLRLLVEDPATSQIGSLIIPLAQVN
jgi:hypothetical protein